MAQNILIDLEKFRSIEGLRSDEDRPEAVYRSNPDNRGMIKLREWASFRFSCRKCSSAPCMEACPVEALEKDGDGMITRAPMLCISCKSCVVICPFGTLMNDHFQYHRDREREYLLSEPEELEALIRQAPEGAITLTDQDEDPELHIYRLTGRILVKERTWEQANP